MFSDKEADQFDYEARANADPAYRSPRYERLQEIIDNEIPAVFIANSLFVYGVSTKVHGINVHSIVNQSERFLDVGHWYINTKRSIK